MILLQIFEWQAMVYLIKSQYGRKCEEILYDHNTENINLTISEERQSNRVSDMIFKKKTNSGGLKGNFYRRKEIQMWKIMKIVGVIVLATNILIIILSMYRNNDTDLLYLRFYGYFFYPAQFIATLAFFCRIHHYMKKLHRYEYEKTRKQMWAFLIVTMASSTLN